MSQKSSTFIRETRERETWLAPTLEREPGGSQEHEPLLATAALIRGAADAIPVSEEAEERSRAQAVQLLQELQMNRSRQTEVSAPWYLRFGSFMRFVFTLGRRR